MEDTMRRDAHATMDGMSASAWSRDRAPRRRSLTDDYREHMSRMDECVERIEAMLRAAERALGLDDGGPA